MRVHSQKVPSKSTDKDVTFKRGTLRFDGASAENRGFWHKAGDWLGLLWFGPRDVVSLELEERRQLNGLRKLMVLIALCVVGAAAYSCYLFAFEGFGYPDDCLIDTPYVWFAYLGRTGACGLVLLLVLNALFKLVSKEKQTDNEKVPLEVLNQMKGMMDKSTSEIM